MSVMVDADVPFWVSSHKLMSTLQASIAGCSISTVRGLPVLGTLDVPLAVIARVISTLSVDRSTSPMVREHSSPGRSPV